MLYEGISRDEVAERIAEQMTQIKPGAIVARTNRGVRLGMSMASVTRLLSKPDRKVLSTRFHADEFIYSRESKKDKDGLSVKFTNYYLFKKGRLYYIELSQDLIGGG